MHAKRARGFRQAAVALAEHARDEPLLELVHRVVELDASVDHFLDEPLEAVAEITAAPGR